MFCLNAVRRISTLLVLDALWLVPLRAQALAPDPLLRWLDRQAQQQLDERERKIAAIRSVANADSRIAQVHQKLLASLGGLPTYSGPLRPRISGQIEAKRYIIEKVIFESLPGFFVTVNVYRPNTAGRHPAILIPAGHTQEGKPEAQILAANLALKGFVAFTYDPIGQGEREQTYLPQLGRALSGGGGNEHLELGARSILIGQSVARYFIFDAKRSVDYLVSRADVDPDRIGVAGCSGGGAIAAYAATFDTRIKAAAAGCFINSFRTLFTGPTADSEMTLPSLLSNGLDWADFFEQRPALPWLLMATTEDYFTPAGARPVYDEARSFYGLYGATEKIRFAVGPGPHGTPIESREEIYRWMHRWLNNGQGQSRDEAVHIYTNRELQVTASGNVDNEPGSRKLHQIIREDFVAARSPRGVPALLSELKRLGVASNGANNITSIDAEHIRFESEPGVTVTAKLYLPKGEGRKPAIVIVEEKRLPVPLFVQRSPSTAAITEAMVLRGHVVLELEPRDSPDGVDGRPFLGNWVTNERAEIVGRNLPAMRAHDILAAVDLLSLRPDVDPKNIRGYARGVKGFWLLLAAAVDPRLTKIWLDRTPHSFAAALHAPLASFLFDALIPGFALHWDMLDLVKATGERRVYWTDPTNWMNQVIDAGTGYRYRYVGEGLDDCLNEFFK